MYVLLTVVTVLLMCQQQQQINMAIATRLPLEVYEMVQHATTQQLHEIHQQQHEHEPEEQPVDFSDATAKRFEYAIISSNGSGDKLAATTTTNTKTSSDSSRRVPATTHAITKGKAPEDMLFNQGKEGLAQEEAITNILSLNEEQQQHHHQQQQIQRKSRQMYDLLQKQQQKHQRQNQHNIRILYQVGESEDDLPVCAPNAVCSKIDLYETPWIERQCRCPEVSRSPEIILHHHSALHTVHGHNHASANTYLYGHSAPHHIQPHPSTNLRQLEKYRSFYEREKAQQQQDNRLFEPHSDIRGATADKFDNVHLKKLMHKLGAVYEDDLHLQAGGFGDMDGPLDSGESNQEGEANSNKAEYDALLMNDLPPATGGTAHNVYSENTAHKRHSAHNMATKMAAAEDSLSIGGCPSGLGIEDGHTIADKTRHYKMCQPVHKLSVCKYFRDYTWTLKTSAKLNVTEQIVHCRCPKNSVTYLTKRDPAEDGSNQYTYLFACSPVTRIRCQRKQPCKLFTVRKRQEFLDEVNINALCQCPKGHHCPSHHTQSGVIPGESFLEDNIQTYSGYCMAND